MLDLMKIREEIDEVDRQLVSLYEKRIALASDVARYKIETGKKVYDEERERAKLSKVEELVAKEDNKHCIKELFRQLMMTTRKMEYKHMEDDGMKLREPYEIMEEIDRKNCKVVYQGVPGAYSYIAMKRFFGEDVDNFNVETFRDAMEADARLSDIKVVYSHPQGLMQCQKYLDGHRDWQQMSRLNTAVSAKMVVDENDVSQAAIASEEAAKVYGLKVLERRINDSDRNTTRFVIVSNKRKFVKNAGKMTICFETDNRPGALYNILGHIIYNDLNMTKIESRPIEGREWEFRFFVDFMGNIDDMDVNNALHGIQEEANKLKFLGNY